MGSSCCLRTRARSLTVGASGRLVVVLILLDLESGEVAPGTLPQTAFTGALHVSLAFWLGPEKLRFEPGIRLAVTKDDGREMEAPRQFIFRYGHSLRRMQVLNTLSDECR